MKKETSFAAKAAKMMAMHALRRDANSTTCLAVYQPKTPAKLSMFKKESTDAD